MANSQVVSLRIPEVLLEKLDEIAESDYPSRTGGKSNRSQVLLDALDFYLQHREGGGRQQINNVNNVSEQEVEEKIEAVSLNFRALLSKLYERIEVLENWKAASDKGEKLPVGDGEDSNAVNNVNEVDGEASPNEAGAPTRMAKEKMARKLSISKRTLDRRIAAAKKEQRIEEPIIVVAGERWRYLTLEERGKSLKVFELETNKSALPPE